MKQFFTGKPNFPYTFGVNIEENEDQFVRKILNAWQEAIFGTSSKSPNQGYSAVSSIVSQKKGLCAKRMELQLYKVDGNPTDKKFSFVNGIIQNVGDVAVSYDDNSSVKYDCTFQYDFMEMLDK
jgi:hypothetical protein